ncbi:hypothetical protein PXO_03752 [Xanthomonas oryzae pv. oryzae PXO99A]|uniref:Uncharacterized protein n=1 Tax=Xanthomonas oryzae pv. oryzae (strain PXO99A) TaxID=360094 RepID=A0A0K0GGD5_XANOP|nr:hypothetical protein PXO_03752 [Xanthomonas oryzae pv. oryzae PXO99A]
MAQRSEEQGDQHHPARKSLYRGLDTHARSSERVTPRGAGSIAQAPARMQIPARTHAAACESASDGSSHHRRLLTLLSH